MTTIYCSNKLREFLGKEAMAVAGAASPFGDWNAHLFYANRHKHLIVVNSKTRYCILIEDIRKSDLKVLDTIFLKRLTSQLVYDRAIDEEQQPLIQYTILPIALSSTNGDKSVLGTINEYVHNYKACIASEYWIGKSLLELNSSFNKIPSGIYKQPYIIPMEAMKSAIATYI